MTGTLAGMLGARGIESESGQLSAYVEGDIEEVGGKMAITRIKVYYRLKGVSDSLRQKAERALKVHEDYCPAALSVKRGISIQWSCSFE